MAKDYSQRLPVDRDGNQMPESHPPFTAIVSYGVDNRATSSAVGLNQNTTAVEVTARGAAVVVKWGTSVIGVTPVSGFDTAVAADTSRILVVPRFQAGNANWNANQNPSITGLNSSEGLYTHMAIASQGPGSVLVAEY